MKIINEQIIWFTLDNSYQNLSVTNLDFQRGLKIAILLGEY